MSKTCLECGSKLIGREDKKFCNDNCRNTYNNHAYKELNGITKKINKILKHNHRILTELNPNEKSKTTHKILTQKGFNFNFFTHELRTKNGNVYHFIYNQGYISIDEQHFIIVKNNEWI